MSSQVPNTSIQMRVMLLKGEVQRVESNYRGLRVRSGRAWVTLRGHDLVLKRGDEIALEGRHDAAVVSPVGHAPLIIELSGEAPRHPTVDPRLAVSPR
jgi:hypothetical protein